jgi:hypothetical protein
MKFQKIFNIRDIQGDSVRADDENFLGIRTSYGSIKKKLNIPRRHHFMIISIPMDMKVDRDSLEKGMFVLNNWNGSFHESFGGQWGVLVHARGFRGMKNRASRVKFIPVQSTCRAAARFQKGE